MDLRLVQNGLDFTRKRKKWLLILTAFGVTSYGAYRVYHIPSVSKKRKRLLKLIEALISVAEVVSDSAETIGVVSKELKEFLQSESDQIPNSLKQISKITKSKEFSDSLVRVTESLTLGVLRGYNKLNGDDELQKNSSFSDRAIEKLFSAAGSGFVSVVVGSFAKSLVLAFYSDQEGSNEQTHSVSRRGSDLSSMPRWVNVICSDKCREVISDCIQLFVSTAVVVYLDKTMNINTYDDIFSGLTNPKHETKVRDILVSVCNGAVETLVKTSHQVLASSNSDSNGGLVSSCFDGDPSTKKNGDFETERLKNSFDGNRENGWVDRMSSTLSVPSNRKLVLDVTGRVTFETVRSFLDFILWKVLDGLKRSFSYVHEEVIERGLEVYEYVCAKSAAIITICITLCLHVAGRAQVLMPA